MNNTWDAKEYEKGFSFVHHYGEEVLDLIDAPHGSLVCDLGCGNGALTRKIAEKGYRSVGIDASEEMLQEARQNNPDLTFVQMDACDLVLDEPAQTIFSNAVFHWIDDADQDRLLTSVATSLAPGGTLVCEFGGHGCGACVHAALAKAFENHGLVYKNKLYFPTIGEYAPRVEAAGMVVEFASLFDRPTPQEGPHGLARWIRMFRRRPFEGITDELRDQIIDEAVLACADELFHKGTWYVDYVRIRLRARKV